MSEEYVVPDFTGYYSESSETSSSDDEEIPQMPDVNGIPYGEYCTKKVHFVYFS